MGKGEQFLEKKMDRLLSMSFCSIPSHTPLYMMAIEKVTLQFHGVGPVNIEYVDKHNDPR